MEKTYPLIWSEKVRGGYAACGHIPGFIDANDPRPAREQIDERYVWGGWKPFKGFKFNQKNVTLEYPGDPPMRAYAMAYLPQTDEMVVVFEHGWVAIVQGDDSVEVARID
jgi:hypothetical protein